MLSSMTGFGKAEGRIRETEVTLELRSVNSRFLEISIVTPRFLSFLDEPLRQYIRQYLQRGNIHCYINMNSNGNTLANYRVNKPLLKNFLKTLNVIAEESGLQPRLSVQDILNQPELLILEESAMEHESIEQQMLALLDLALKELMVMQEREGNYIRELFHERIQTIEERLKSIETLQRSNIKEHIAAMRKRIETLVKDIRDEGSFHQEVVQLADKLDIQEETDRFYSHIRQFKDYLNSEEAVGKRLNFLLQEMNREVTTLGNKASNPHISQHVVEIKNELETIREQVQNIK
ncbi:MAG: YicC/YloC family endoribonuclease [bacterium]|jgi:uncharacterized protein (TIGR00255 family)|nr:YicC/YloC family endoribonuclease [bacterium]